MFMGLYTPCFHPFLTFMDRNLPGIRIGRRTRPTSVVAYADDVAIFLTSVADFSAIEEALDSLSGHLGHVSTPENQKHSQKEVGVHKRPFQESSTTRLLLY